MELGWNNTSAKRNRLAPSQFGPTESHSGLKKKKATLEPLKTTVEPLRKATKSRDEPLKSSEKPQKTRRATEKPRTFLNFKFAGDRGLGLPNSRVTRVGTCTFAGDRGPVVPCSRFLLEHRSWSRAHWCARPLHQTGNTPITAHKNHGHSHRGTPSVPLTLPAHVDNRYERRNRALLL